MNFTEIILHAGGLFRHKAKHIKTSDGSNVQDKLDSITNPLLFKGVINVAADFPDPLLVKEGWVYRVASDVIDNDPTKTNTGQEFYVSDEIAWNGTNWSELGSTKFKSLFSDSEFKLYDNADITKNLVFEVSGITTGQTRTITVPDRNLDLAAPIFNNVRISTDDLPTYETNAGADISSYIGLKSKSQSGLVNFGTVTWASDASSGLGWIIRNTAGKDVIINDIYTDITSNLAGLEYGDMVFRLMDGTGSLRQERMRISKDGIFGFNTDSPNTSYVASVKGSAFVNSGIALQYSVSGLTTAIFSYDNNTGDTILGTTVNGGNLHLYAGGTNVIYIRNSNKYVGIGHTPGVNSPQQKFDIFENSTSNVAIRLGNTASKWDLTASGAQEFTFTDVVASAARFSINQSGHFTVGSSTATSAVHIVHTDTIARQAGYNWLVNSKSVNSLFLDTQGTLGRLRLARYNSSGVFVDSPIEMYNDTGMVYINNGVTISGDVSGMSSDMIDDDIFGNIENAIIFLSSLSRPNLAINSNFDFWQEGTSVSSGTDQRRTSDGGFSLSVGTTYTAAQQSFTAGQTSVPNGPTYYKRVVSSSIAGAGNLCLENFEFEKLKETAGKQVTFSIWLKADSTKNISCEFLYKFGTGGSSSVTAIGVKKQQIGTTWARYSFTASMPSISGKTIGTTPGVVRVHIWFDAGSDFNGRTDSLGQQSGTFDMAQYKFEIGPTATDWEPYNLADELVKCQRYCEKSYDVNVALGSVGSSGAIAIRATTNEQYPIGMQRPFKVNKAYSPTITWYSTNSGSIHNIYCENPAGDRGVGDTLLENTYSTGYPVLTTANAVSGAGYYAHFVARAYL